MTDTSTSDFWHVEVAPGDVRVVSLEQLDDAFQREVINVETRVWQEGLPNAIRLGDLLGDDAEQDEDPTPVDLSAGRHTPAPPTPSKEPPLPSRPRDSQDTLIGLSPPSVEGASASRSPTPAAGRPAEPEFAPAPSSPWAPGAPNVAAMRPVTPQPSAPPIPAPAVAPPSIAPLAVDIGDELAFARPNRGKKVLVALGGTLAVAAGIALAVNASGAKASSEEEPVTAAAAPAAQPYKGKAYDPGSGPVKVSEGDSLNALTVRDPAARTETTSSKPKTSKAASKSKRWKPKPKAKSVEATFTSKGKNHAYDPLNGSLR